MTYKKNARKPRIKGRGNQTISIRIVVVLLAAGAFLGLMLYIYKENLVEIMSSTSLIEDDESIYSGDKDKYRELEFETTREKESTKHLEYRKNDRDYLNKIIEKYE